MSDVLKSPQELVFRTGSLWSFPKKQFCLPLSERASQVFFPSFICSLRPILLDSAKFTRSLCRTWIDKCRQTWIWWHLAQAEKKHFKLFQLFASKPVVKIFHCFTLPNGKQKSLQRKNLLSAFFYWHWMDQNWIIMLPHSPLFPVVNLWGSKRTEISSEKKWSS